MSIWIKRLLCALGLYSFPVEVLHGAYLRGDIGSDTLYKLLKPQQLLKFIEHHNEVKASFQKSEVLGLTKTDEMFEGLRNLTNDPLMRAVLTMHGAIVLTSTERQRMVPALNQLDGKILHRVLEREVMARHGKQNVIMDQADSDPRY